MGSGEGATSSSQNMQISIAGKSFGSKLFPPSYIYIYVIVVVNFVLVASKSFFCYENWDE